MLVCFIPDEGVGGRRLEFFLSRVGSEESASDGDRFLPPPGLGSYEGGPPSLLCLIGFAKLGVSKEIRLLSKPESERTAFMVGIAASDGKPAPDLSETCEI